MRGLSGRLPFLGSILGLTVFFGVNQLQASDVDLFSQLKKAGVQSQSVGESFYLQSLIKKTPTELREILQSDVSQLQKLIPGLSFARAFKTESGKKVLYMKLKGLLDGTGLLMEVKQGLDPLFESASELPFDEADLNFSSRQWELRNPWQSAVDQSLESRKTAGSAATLNPQDAIVLEGPLNTVMDLNGLQIGVLISLQQLNETSSSSDGQLSNTQSTYVVSQFSFMRTDWTGEWGRFTNFGSREINLAEVQAAKILQSIGSRIAAIK